MNHYQHLQLSHDAKNVQKWGSAASAVVPAMAAAPFGGLQAAIASGMAGLLIQYSVNRATPDSGNQDYPTFREGFANWVAQLRMKLGADGFDRRYSLADWFG